MLSVTTECVASPDSGSPICLVNIIALLHCARHCGAENYKHNMVQLSGGLHQGRNAHGTLENI